MSLEQAIEAIYVAMKNDNHEIELRIRELKTAMADSGTKVAMFEPAKLVQNNRQGRKLMQSFFRQKGVAIDFVK